MSVNNSRPRLEAACASHTRSMLRALPSFQPAGIGGCKRDARLRPWWREVCQFSLQPVQTVSKLSACWEHRRARLRLRKQGSWVIWPNNQSASWVKSAANLKPSQRRENSIHHREKIQISAEWQGNEGKGITMPQKTPFLCPHSFAKNYTMRTRMPAHRTQHFY